MNSEDHIDRILNSYIQREKKYNKTLKKKNKKVPLKTYKHYKPDPIFWKGLYSNADEFMTEHKAMDKLQRMSLENIMSCFTQENKDHFNKYISQLHESSKNKDIRYLITLYNRRVKIKRYEKKEDITSNISNLINGIRQGISSLKLNKASVFGDPELGRGEDFDSMFSIDVEIDDEFWKNLPLHEAWLRVVKSSSSTSYTVVYYNTFRSYVSSLLTALQHNATYLLQNGASFRSIESMTYKINAITQFLESNEETVMDYIKNKGREIPQDMSLQQSTQRLSLLVNIQINTRELEQAIELKNIPKNTQIIDKISLYQHEQQKKEYKMRLTRHMLVTENINTLLHQCFANNGIMTCFSRLTRLFTVYKHPTEMFYVPISYKHQLPVYYTSTTDDINTSYDLDGKEFKHYMLLPGKGHMKRSPYYIDVTFTHVTPQGTSVMYMSREGVDYEHCFQRNIYTEEYTVTKEMYDSAMKKLYNVHPGYVLQNINGYIQYIIQSDSSCFSKLLMYVSEQLDRLYYHRVISYDTVRPSITSSLWKKPFRTGSRNNMLWNSKEHNDDTEEILRVQYRLENKPRLEHRKGRTGGKRYYPYNVVLTKDLYQALQNFNSNPKYANFQRIDTRSTGELINTIDIDDLLPLENGRKNSQGYDILDRKTLEEAVKRLWYYETENDRLEVETREHAEATRLQLKRKKGKKQRDDEIQDADRLVGISTLFFNNIEDVPCIYFD